MSLQELSEDGKVLIQLGWRFMGSGKGWFLWFATWEKDGVYVRRRGRSPQSALERATRVVKNQEPDYWKILNTNMESEP